MKHRRFGIIIDEAHSSQNGSMSAKMNIALSGNVGEEGMDLEDRLNAIIEGRQMIKNANYYAFTATPKNKTLQMFGTPFNQPNGEIGYRPFHEYTMKQAIEEGASEIDMVINLGDVKQGDFEAVTNEIGALKEACGDKILKVIIETCYLTKEEKIAMCHAVTNAGADFIKTSTGFSTAGATFEDVKLMHDHVGEGVKVKAAGGISSFDDAKEFMSLGADRLGTSRLVKIMKNTDNGAGY